MSAFNRYLLAAVLLSGLSGCIAHQREHSIVRIWADWNSYEQCSLCMEQLDHKPLRAARVGAFIWMYDNDPGHQAAYAKARMDWEALVAARLNEATDAVNQPGVSIGGASCEPVEQGAVIAPSETVAPQMSDEKLPPMPKDSSPANVEVPAVNGPAVVAPKPAAESLDVPSTGKSAVPQQPASPRRLPTALPNDPPGVPTDGPFSSANSTYQLSGFNKQTSSNVTPPAPKGREYRRPTGAWLFSNP